MRTKLHNCHINAECLGHSHEGCLVVVSVSARPFELSLDDSVGILVVFLIPLAIKILSPLCCRIP